MGFLWLVGSLIAGACLVAGPAGLPFSVAAMTATVQAHRWLTEEISGREAIASAAVVLACAVLFFVGYTDLSLPWGIPAAAGGATTAFLLWLVHQPELERRAVSRQIAAGEYARWKRAVAADPGNAGAHLYLGHALLQQGHCDEAGTAYRAALDLDPTCIHSIEITLAGAPEAHAAKARTHLPDLRRIAEEVASGRYHRPGSGPACRQR